MYILDTRLFPLKLLINFMSVKNIDINENMNFKISPSLSLKILFQNLDKYNKDEPSTAIMISQRP